jgi:hypothetical protein
MVFANINYSMVVKFSAGLSGSKLLIRPFEGLINQVRKLGVG